MSAQILTERIVILSPERAPITHRPVSDRRFSAKRVKESILHILQDILLCSISTVTRGQRAYISTAYFCYSEDLELYFLSDPGSTHCRNLSTNSSMAMTIFSSAQKWSGPDRGIQLFGTCRGVRGHEITKSERLYGKRFPAYRKWKTHQSKNARRRPFRYKFYRFLPNKIKVLDESEFGQAAFVVAAVRRGH